MSESLIVEVLQHYYPSWLAPEPTRFVWCKARCPFHDDENPSAGLSFERNAFRCHACGMSGDAYSIVATKEGISYRKAIELTPEILGRSDSPVSPEPARKSGRRLFGAARAVPEQPRSREVPARVRRRTFSRP